jgi:hypothetical protein
MALDAEAGAAWEGLYHTLEDHPDTVFGAATSRASDQAMKLALLFALADRAEAIRSSHLTAALACWRYCEATARLLFGDADLPQPGTKPGAVERLALRLVKPILMTPGINRRELFKSVGNKPDKTEMNSALGLLHAHGLARSERTETDGRPSERWFPATDPDGTTRTPPTATATGPLVLKVAEVKMEELPAPPGLSLEPPMTLTELFEAVRVRGGKLAWQDGAVRVVGLDEVSDRMRGAVADHQDMLRQVVPVPSDEDAVPTDEEFKQRLLSLLEDPPLDIFPPEDASTVAAK